MKKAYRQYAKIICSIGLCLLWSWQANVRGDSFSEPYSRAVCSENGKYVFIMALSRDPTAKAAEVSHAGVCYQVAANGSLVEVWRTNGWLDSHLILSNDGEYLVNIHHIVPGDSVAPGDIGIEVFFKGKMRSQCRVIDLLEKTSRIHLTASHYLWLLPSKDIRLIDRELILQTIDGGEHRIQLPNLPLMKN